MADSEPTPPPPFVERVRWTFAAPTRLVQSLGPQPPWGAALALATAVTVFSVLFLPTELLVAQAEAAARRAEIDLTTDPALIARWQRTMAVMGAFVVEPLRIAALAGIAMLLFSVIGRGPARFTEYLALTAHARLITALGVLLALPIQVSTGDFTWSFSLSALVPFLPRDTLVYRALEFTDIFAVWMLAVIGVGSSVLNGHRTTARAVGILLGGYLLMNLILAALTLF